MRDFLLEIVAHALLAAEPEWWSVGPTPTELDRASRSPVTMRTATIMDRDEAVGTFWSCLMDGEANAAAAHWCASNGRALMSGRTALDAGEGLRLLAAVRYAGWWPGPTPGYLAGSDQAAVTLRSPEHTEEVATFWRGRAETAARVVTVVMSAAPDLIAANLGEGGASAVIAALCPRSSMPEVVEPGALARTIALAGTRKDAGWGPVAGACGVLRSAMAAKHGRCVSTDDIPAGW